MRKFLEENLKELNVFSNNINETNKWCSLIFDSFQMICKQFPIRLNFVITIRKVQGKILSNTDICLFEHVLSEGHIYIILSHRIVQLRTKVLELFVYILETSSINICC